VPETDRGGDALLQVVFEMVRIAAGTPLLQVVFEMVRIAAGTPLLQGNLKHLADAVRSCNSAGLVISN